jgi:hypothetical protein
MIQFIYFCHFSELKALKVIVNNKSNVNILKTEVAIYVGSQVKRIKCILEKMVLIKKIVKKIQLPLSVLNR